MEVVTQESLAPSSSCRNRFDATASITVCAFTIDPTSAPLFRLVVEPYEQTGLNVPCRLMIDKITTVQKPGSAIKSAVWTTFVLWQNLLPKAVPAFLWLKVL